MKKIIILIICLLCLCSCSKSETIEEASEPEDNSETTEELAQEDENNYPEIELTDLTDILTSDSNLSAANSQYSKFAANLFKNSFKENENGLISPYSLYAVLSVLANGANNSNKANTKLLLENVLGMTVNDLNKFYSYTNSNLDIVNGLLFNTDFGIKISDNLKRTIKEYYGNAIKEKSFSNVNQLVTDVNKWSMDSSNGLIPTIIDNSDITNETILLLLNGLSVEGDWHVPFSANNTVLQNFNNSDGSKVNVSMMKDTISGYWQIDNATGFTKELVNGYTFVGILPNEDVNINEFINTIDENTIEGMINSYVYTENLDEETFTADLHFTNLSFPKFEYSVSYQLDETLKQLGLNSLFDYKACDFSSFGSEKIYLQETKQKTNVEVNEDKVKMSAITVVMGARGATGFGARNTYYHDVTFDKPFVYALVKNAGDYDNPCYITLFMGVVNTMENETSVKTNEDNSIGVRIVDADSIKIRSTPTVKENNQIGLAKKGSGYPVYEVKENDGYTWYRIAENAWIADDGTWTHDGYAI